MAVVFLIGGTGNQLFSYAASKETDKISTIFLSSFVRKILGWTQHEQTLKFDQPNIFYHMFALACLVIDLPLAKVTGKTLFTELDTRSIKATPKIAEIARLGYFQQAPERRDLSALRRQIAPKTEAGQIVVHVRGGDLLALENAGTNTYGLPSAAYYRNSIKIAFESFEPEQQKTCRVLVLTDDLEYANTLNLDVEGLLNSKIRHCPLGETLSLAIGADWFVSSNSTLAYWILRLRKGQKSLALQPFQKRYDYDLPDETTRVTMDYG